MIYARMTKEELEAFKAKALDLMNGDTEAAQFLRDKLDELHQEQSE